MYTKEDVPAVALLDSDDVTVKYNLEHKEPEDGIRMVYAVSCDTPEGEQALLDLEGVLFIQFDGRVCTIVKEEDPSWCVLRPQIEDVLVQYYSKPQCL